MVRDPAIGEASFPIARCDSCDRSVLTYLRLDGDGVERRFCTHCDAAVTEKLEWVSADELESVGYYFGSRPPASGGCGCGSGGCARKN